MADRFPGISDFDILGLGLKSLKYDLTEAGDDRLGLDEMAADEFGDLYESLSGEDQDKLLDVLEGVIRKFAKGLMRAVDGTVKWADEAKASGEEFDVTQEDDSK